FRGRRGIRNVPDTSTVSRRLRVGVDMGVFRMKRLVTIAACAALAGCATSPKDIAPSYVSPILYQNLSCDQLSQEALRVSNAAAVATGQQQNQANKDAAMMTVGMILFWPSLFM